MPASRLGRATLSLSQLNLLHEDISVAMFLVISLWAWKQPRCQEVLAFGLMLCGLTVGLLGRR